MAKKKNSAKSQASRKGKVTAKDVLEWSRKFHDVAESIGGLAVSMEDKGIDEIYVDGYSKPDRAVRVIGEYLANLRHSLERAAFLSVLNSLTRQTAMHATTHRWT